MDTFMALKISPKEVYNIGDNVKIIPRGEDLPKLDF
jgi:hypothetical protein